MRQDFVDYVKTRMSQKLNYKSRLDELRKEMLVAGATEEEFNEAIKQLDSPTPSTPILTTNPLPDPPVPQETKQISQKKDASLVKRLIELDLTAHVITGVILIVLCSFFAWSYIQNNKLSIFPTPNTQSAQALPSTDQTLVPKVYANTIPVDPNTIFSIPPSSLTLAISGTPKKDIFGFFPYWMLSDENQVSLNALTTISLFGIEMNGKGNIVTNNGKNIDDGWSMWNNPKMNDLLLRAEKRKIKVQLTIKVFNNNDIENIVTSDTAQKNFIANVMYLMNEKSLDGINLDFEYVGTPDDSIRNNFTRFVTNLNTEMKRQYPQSLLTIDTYVTSANTSDLFDLTQLSPQVDAFVIMGYDFHTPTGSPGPIAPLEGENSILTSVESYLDKVSPDKIILALPYYGYDWNVPNVNQPASMIPYAQAAMQSKNYTINWDDASQTPWYSYVDQSKDTHHVYFENVRSLGEKYDLINRKGLRGVGIWALGYDGLNADLRELLLEKFATSK